MFFTFLLITSTAAKIYEIYSNFQRSPVWRRTNRNVVVAWFVLLWWWWWLVLMLLLGWMVVLVAQHSGEIPSRLDPRQVWHNHKVPAICGTVLEQKFQKESNCKRRSVVWCYNVWCGQLGVPMWLTVWPGVAVGKHKSHDFSVEISTLDIWTLSVNGGFLNHCGLGWLHVPEKSNVSLQNFLLIKRVSRWHQVVSAFFCFIQKHIHALQLHQNPWFWGIGWKCSDTELSVLECNNPAVRCYEKAGFKRKGERKAIWGQKFSASNWLVYRKVHKHHTKARKWVPSQWSLDFSGKKNITEKSHCHTLQISGLRVSLCHGFEVNGVKKNLSACVSHMADQKRNMFNSHPDRFWLPQKLGASCNFLIWTMRCFM